MLTPLWWSVCSSLRGVVSLLRDVYVRRNNAADDSCLDACEAFKVTDVLLWARNVAPPGYTKVTL